VSSGGPDRVGPAKFLPVHRKQPVVAVRRREQIEFVDVGRGLAPTAAQGLTPPRPIDQDASHRLGRGAEKVRTIVPLRLLAGAEPRSGFTPRCSMPPTSNDSRNRGIPPSPSLRRDKKAPPSARLRCRSGFTPRPLKLRSTCRGVACDVPGAAGERRPYSAWREQTVGLNCHGTSNDPAMLDHWTACVRNRGFESVAPRRVPPVNLAASLCLIRLRQQLGYSLRQIWQLVLHEIPDDLIVDTFVAMDQAIPQADDSWDFGNRVHQRRRFAGRVSQRLADDLEFALDRRGALAARRRPEHLEAFDAVPVT